MVMTRLYSRFHCSNASCRVRPSCSEHRHAGTPHLEEVPRPQLVAGLAVQQVAQAHGERHTPQHRVCNVPPHADVELSSAWEDCQTR